MRYLIVAIVFMASTLPASAHPGSHSDVTSFAAGLNHFVSSPFHVVLATAVLLTAAGLGIFLRKRRHGANKKALR